MALSRNDPLRLQAIAATVPVRDGLQAYVELMRDEAQVAYRHAQSLFVAGGLKEAPRVPDLLRERPRRRAPGEKFVAPEKPAFLTALEQAEEG